MQVIFFAFFEFFSQLKWVLEKQVIQTTWWYQLFGSDANILAVGLGYNLHRKRL